MNFVPRQEDQLGYRRIALGSDDPHAPTGFVVE